MVVIILSTSTYFILLNNNLPKVSSIESPKYYQLIIDILIRMLL